MPERKMLGLLAAFVAIGFVSGQPFSYVTIDQCTENGEYYNLAELQCSVCGENQEPTTDGMSCQCNSYYKTTKNNGGPADMDIECSACPTGQRSTTDGWECISCNILINQECEPCLAGQIALDYSVTGELLTNRTCESCSSISQPDSEGQECVRCHQSFIEQSTAETGVASCTCPTIRQYVDVCFPAGTALPNPSSAAYNVPYTILDGNEVTSWFFVQNFIEVEGTCKEYKNFTGCQTWGNLCTMALTRQTHQTCQNYRTYIANQYPTRAHANPDWPAHMPWLYYEEDPADMVLTSRDVEAIYTFDSTFPSSKLQLLVAQYTANGTFLGVDPTTGGRLQLCKDTEKRMDAAYNFATTYKSSCSIPAVDFWDKLETVFFDMYLLYEDQNGDSKLFPVPVLLSNYGSENQGSDQTQWQLTRRFFLVDNMSGKVTATDPASAIRYASTFKLEINLRDGSSAGMIYPPLLRITYSELSRQDYTDGNTARVSFEVTYSQDQSSTFQSMSISLGVFCAAFLLFAMFKTNAWRRRSGLIVINPASMLKFILFSCGLIADAFIIVTVGVSLYWLLFFKRQDRVYLLLPTDSQAGPFFSYVIVAFVMKLLDVLHMLFVQCRSEIFLIDWERSRGRVVQASSNPNAKAPVAPISAWRSIFVANEWNELQELRRANPLLQVMTVLFFLEVIGLKNLTTTDPRSSVNPASDEYIGEYTYVLRFGMAAGLYILVGLTQWLFYTLFYERFVEDALRNFVDLCSMANISVFVLTQNNYGFYIHGRSVHGFADTNMKEIKNQLKREEDSSIPERGLEPNTDQQTFEILLSSTFRDRYNDIVMPLRAPGAARGAGARNDDDKVNEAYVSLNKFLSTFINHGMADIDYVVKDKLLLEKILDMEFYDPTDKGFFFNDDGHAFQKAIFYGNEMTLLVFELLLFCLIDLIFTDFVLAGVITYLGTMTLVRVRDSFGRSNVAKKTLVDERFLI